MQKRCIKSEATDDGSELGVRASAIQKRSIKKEVSGASKKGKPCRATSKEVVLGEPDEAPNVFHHEMDALECEICFKAFESQIYMCKNGHAACANCCINTHRKCSSCNEPIEFRCRAMEKILSAMTRPCRFSKHGCPETVKFTEMRSHEDGACTYVPYSCPFDGCAYCGMQLYSHIQNDHAPEDVTSDMALLRGTRVTLQKGAPFHALLQRDRQNILVLLNGSDVLAGRSLSMVRICPHPDPEDEDVEVEYKVVVTSDEPGSLSLTASGTVQYVRRLEGYQPKGFLFVPDAFWGSSGSVTVTMHL